MNILVVNAYGTSKISQEKFSHFRTILTEAVKKASLKYSVDKVLYSFRDIETMDDYILSLRPGKASEEQINESKNNFNKLDLILIEGGGEKKNLPWLPYGEKIYTLVKLCELAGKHLLMSGIGTLHLVKYLATKDKDVNIINSSGEFPSIEDLEKIPSKDLVKLKLTDKFLDYATGDLYEFNDYKKEWIPKLNIGIHSVIYAEKFYQRGKFVLKNYKDSADKSLISSVRHEIKIEVEKKCSLHWLLKGVPNEFVGFTSLSWYIHNVCVEGSKEQFKILANSYLGPMIIEHNNSIGLIFHIKKMHKATELILQNFLDKKFSEIKAKDKGTHGIIDFANMNKDAVFRNVVKEDLDDKDELYLEHLSKIRPTSSIALVSQSRLYGKKTYCEDEDVHCGCSYNTKHMIFLKNNSVIKNKVVMEKFVKPPEFELTEKEKEEFKINAHGVNDRIVLEHYKKMGRDICFKLQKESVIKNSSVFKLNKRAVSATSRNPANFKGNVGQRKLNKNRSTSVLEVKNPKPELKNSASAINYDKITLEPDTSLAIMFPYICEENFKMGKKIEDKKVKKEVIRLNMQTKIKSNYVEKFKKYEQDLSKLGDRPSVRCSSIYIDPEAALRKYQIEDKKNWMSKEDFRRVFGISTTNKRDKDACLANYNLLYEQNNGKDSTIQEYKTGVLGYQFRTFDKSKWVCKKDFIV